MKYVGPSYKPNNQPFCIDDLPMGGFVKVTFLKIVDGDTAHFLLEAKNYTNQVLSKAKTIYLQSDRNDSLYDDTQSHRLLAWIWADYKLLNYQLVEKGYASVRYVNSEKLSYLDDLYKAQDIAIAKKRGIHNKKDDGKEAA